MKKLLGLLIICGSTYSHAGLPEMMKIYNNPTLAPMFSACAGHLYCNGFTALSKQWASIPKNYKYKGKWDIRSMAEKGDGERLYRGFSFGEEESVHYYLEAGSETYYQYDSPHHNELTFARGVAVILYMKEKNGW